MKFIQGTRGSADASIKDINCLDVGKSDNCYSPK